MSTASLRLFFAADLAATQRMRRFAASLRETGAPLKMVNLDILHLTLKFLGDTDEGLVDDLGDVLERVCLDVGPIHVSLRGSGAFPNADRIKVVWIGMTGAEALAGIARGLDDGLSPLGFKRERRPFRPHITIARMKGGRNKDRVQAVLRDHRDSEFGEQTIDAVRLKRSVLSPKGPSYTTLREVSLG